jgi:hypothetical protein
LSRSTLQTKVTVQYEASDQDEIPRLSSRHPHARLEGKGEEERNGNKKGGKGDGKERKFWELALMHQRISEL